MDGVSRSARGMCVVARADQHVRSEVRAARCCPRGIWRQLATPDRALVSDEGTNPVTGPLAQHRVAILAAGNQHVRPIVLK